MPDTTRVAEYGSGEVAGPLVTSRTKAPVALSYSSPALN